MAKKSHIYRVTVFQIGPANYVRFYTWFTDGVVLRMTDSVSGIPCSNWHNGCSAPRDNEPMASGAISTACRGGPLCHRPLDRCVKLRVAHAPGMPGALSPLQRVSDPDMHHGTCVKHVP